MTIWLCSLKNQRMPLSYYRNTYAKRDLKRIKVSSRDVIIQETHMKKKMRD